MSDSEKLSYSSAEAGPLPRASFRGPLVLLLLLVTTLVAVRALGLQDYLEETRLRGLIAAYGFWAPLVYLLLWTIVPSLFVPSLPLTLAGGILFGPFWGVVYTVCGATVGASITFLISRYLARDWVAQKIAGAKLSHLDDKVAAHSWKIVVLLRLIPVFPFFTLNYAFGLTRIPLLPYALATFFAILPWTTAYIYFASNLLVVFQGKLSTGLLLGAALILAAGLLTWLARKRLAQKNSE